MKHELAKSSALFAPRQLTLARKTRGHTKSRLANLVDITPTSVAFFESGESRPTPETVAKLAKALNFPVGFFSREAEVFDDTDDEITPFFRSLRKTPQLERERATGVARLVYRLSQSLEEFVDFPVLDVPEIWVSEDAERVRIEKIADKVRAQWKLGDEPIPHMVRLLESHGVLVVRQTLKNTDMSAFSYRFGKRPLVLLGDDIDDAARTRFNAAHELGHLIMHNGDCVGTTTVEKQANMFASAFLMPRKRFLETFLRPLNWANLGEMKHFWKVSMAAILYRGHELGVLSDASYRRIVVKMSSMGWKKDEPMNLRTNEAPVILRKAVEALQDDVNLRKKVIDRVYLPSDLLDSLLLEKATKRSLILD